MKKRDKIVLSTSLSMGCSAGFDGNWLLVSYSYSDAGEVYNYTYPNYYCESAEDGSWEYCYTRFNIWEIIGTTLTEHVLVEVSGYDKDNLDLNDYSDGECTFSSGFVNCLYAYEYPLPIVKMSNSRFKIDIFEYGSDEAYLSCSLTADKLNCSIESTYADFDQNYLFVKMTSDIPQPRDAFGSSGVKMTDDIEGVSE